MLIRTTNRHLSRLLQTITNMDASAYSNLKQTNETDTPQHPQYLNFSNLNVDMDAMTITEGKAKIHLSTKKVFYNPVQEFNRDLSIAVLSVFAAEYYEERFLKEQERKAKCEAQGLPVAEEDTSKYNVKILEPLSATGLRAIRYAKEVPNVSKVVANDMNRLAVEVIKENILLNEVCDRVDVSLDDACMVMYKHRRKEDRFTAIDLDPYGSPTIFLDSAVQAVSDGGLLLVTATDMAVLAGNCPETCYVKYGAISLKTKSCHEMALRIMLQCIEAHANRYGRYIEPLLSVSVDFYIRVFVKIHTGAAKCKLTTTKLSMVHNCTGCGSVTLQPLGGVRPNPTDKNPAQMRNFLPTGPPLAPNCVHCDSKHHLGGPIWSGPLHDTEFVGRVLLHVCKNSRDFGTFKRLEGMLSVVKEEILAPLYHTTDTLFGRMHLEVMKMVMLRSAIMNAGYQVSYSHACKSSVKTDAPAQLMWDIVRTWEKDHPVNPAKLESDMVARNVLQQSAKHVIDLTIAKDANPVSRRDGCLRFQTNPAPFWGPGTKSSINVGDHTHQKGLTKQMRKNKDKRTALKRKHGSETEETANEETNENEHMSDGQNNPEKNI